MKTNVRSVSIATHRTNNTDGTYDRTTEIIIDYIRKHPGALMTQIAEGTGLRINQVSGRCNELKGGIRKRRDGTTYHSPARIGEGEEIETAPGHYAHRLYMIEASALCHTDNDSRLNTVTFSKLADGQISFS